MNKTVKRILFGVIGFIVVITLLFVGLMIKVKSETKGMTPIETKKIVDNIFSIKDETVNVFVIQDGHKYILIDAGNTTKTVASELQKLSINPDSVVAILLTHTDRDHVGSLKLFKKAKIYLSKPEEDMITGKKSKLLIFGNKIKAKNYTLLDDQQVLTIGTTKIKGIVVNGHTSGSMCYVVNDKYFFVGDVLSLKDGKIDKFNDFFNMDTPTATQSMSKITAIPNVEYLFSAHYGYTNNYQNAVKDWKN